MDVLLESATFWLTFLTTLTFLIGFCYLNSLYADFGIPWGNVSVADVLVKSLPGLGVIIVALTYLVTEPAFPWSAVLREIRPDPINLARILMVLAAVCALVAVTLGKLRASRLRKSRRKVQIRCEKRTWHGVVIIAFGKDLISFFDPQTEQCFLVPWSEVRHIRTAEARIGTRSRRQ